MNSTTHSDDILDALQRDTDARADVQALADRDDHLGALARVVLAIADGDRPAPEDCEQAGLDALTDIYAEGDDVN